MSSEDASDISEMYLIFPFLYLFFSKSENSENDLGESDESENFREILKIYKKSERNSKLPNDISDLMGEANHLFIKNEWEKAKQKCYEIIQQYPNFSEPYKLLAKISGKKN